jgi:hypothetical protein
MADKVTIRVTRHMGTADQTQELHRLTLGSDGVATLTVKLDSGRRTALATVPPPAQRKTNPESRGGSDRVYNTLRMMSDPVYSGMTKQGMMAGAAGSSAGSMFDTPPPVEATELVHQNKLATTDTLHTGAEIMGEVVVAPDRSKVTVHMAPVFQTATDRPDVKLTAIPGGQ